MSCPLCRAQDITFYHRDNKREYLQCQRCSLVYVAENDRLNLAAEKAEYDLHDNDPNDEGYRRFLSRLVTPLQQRLEPNAKGLDFGCGPGPTLSVMMEEAGWPIQLYDIFYYDDRSYLQKKYDFITATEVIEHVFDPYELVKRLWELLEPGGYLALMTKLLKNKEAFSQWHYKNDQTHVCFYSKSTFQTITEKLGAELEFIDDDVIFLKKMNA